MRHMSTPTPRRGRRSVAAGLTLALSASLALLSAPAAHAATPFVVVGTSDVSDSGLVANVIEPRFEAAYPQYDLQYVSKGTGAALTDARNGLAAAAIVHAAGIENQFVRDGYSLEQYGRLVFWGDYVLAGPSSDPAGVLNGGATDVVTAFEKVAAAGAAGKASFVTRGGTPGTAVQEHAIWALTSGVPTCVVGQPAGGGTRPKAPGEASNACTSPDDQTADPDGAAWPTWYNAGNAGSQAANVNIANTCPSATFPNGNCYIFTDRGTLKYLQSQGGAQNLKVLTRDNATTARGGRDALINVFHAYAVNPAKFANPSSTKTDPVAATAFLDFMTSSATQTAIGSFLAEGDDPAFIPSATPVIEAALKKDTIKAGKKSTIKGSIANAVPGYPALNGVSVSLLEAKTSSFAQVPKTVATATTDATGAFTLKHKLKAGRFYRIGVPQIAKAELPNLNPVFGSILSAGTQALGTAGGFKLRPAKKLGQGRFVLAGKLASKSDGKGKITVRAAKGKGKFKKIAKVKIKDGKTRFTVRDKLAPGTYKVQLTFDDKGDTLPATSKTIRVTLP